MSNERDKQQTQKIRLLTRRVNTLESDLNSIQDEIEEMDIKGMKERLVNAEAKIEELSRLIIQDPGSGETPKKLVLVKESWLPFCRDILGVEWNEEQKPDQKYSCQKVRDTAADTFSNVKVPWPDSKTRHLDAFCLYAGHVADGILYEVIDFCSGSTDPGIPSKTFKWQKVGELIVTPQGEIINL